MKRITAVVLSALLFVSGVIIADAAQQDKAPETSAEAYVLYCTDNGEILSSKNETKRMKPASTTKLMTTLIALEYACSCNKTVEFTDEMMAEGSSMYLKRGERLTLKDLAAGMMMASGNDAANATAITIAGNSESFAEKMNEKARLIGMKDTHFVTPSGLDDENHYTTAYDMALLMSYALENDDFALLTSQKSVAVDFIEPKGKRTVYANHNRLLSLYDSCTGGKTGYTMAAGRCLVTSAKKNGLTLVCVTLNDRNDWNDHKTLYEYGYSMYGCYEGNDKEFYLDMPCTGGEKQKVGLVGEKNISIVLPVNDLQKVKRKVYADSFEYAPIKEGQVCGRIEYSIDGKTKAQVRLIAAESSEIKYKKKNLWQRIKEFFTYG